VKTLVLTPEKDYINDANDLLLISKWCKWKNVFQKDIAYETCEFHWNDREKFDQDYNYLKNIHDNLVSILASALNQIHEVNYSNRAWQVILDPWLLSYISVLWDRWEQARLIYEKQAGNIHLYIDKYITPAKPPFDYNEYIKNALSDEWNRELYWDIIKYRYNQLTVFSYLENHREAKKISKISASISFKKTLNNLLIYLWGPRKKIFADISFDLLNRLYLSLRFKRLLVAFPAGGIDSDDFCYDADMRSKLSRLINSNQSGDANFETYLNSRLAHALPTVALEAFAKIRGNNKRFLRNTDLFISSGSAWINPSLKGCMAEAVNASIPIFQVEHGGSFPAKHELFDFEEDISDVRGTWYIPYHLKHKKILHPKIARVLNRYFFVYWLYGSLRLRNFCLVVAAESPPYVYRAHYYPMAEQSLSNLEMNTNFIDNLQDNIRSNVRVKPYFDSGWNTAQEYLERYGDEMVIKDLTLQQSFRRAKVIVCTYPETTFSEAMASGIPTILLFDPIYYERNPICEELLNEMINVNIIFYNHHDAAEHLNKYWHDIESWWFSPETVLIRNKFLAIALCKKNDWLNHWLSIMSTIKHTPTFSK